MAKKTKKAPTVKVFALLGLMLVISLLVTSLVPIQTRNILRSKQDMKLTGKAYSSNRYEISLILPEGYRIHENILDTFIITNQPPNLEENFFELSSDKTFISIDIGGDLTKRPESFYGSYPYVKNIVSTISNKNILTLDIDGEVIEVIKPIQIGNYSGYLYKTKISEKPVIVAALTGDSSTIIIRGFYGTPEKTFEPEFVEFFEKFTNSIVIGN